MNVTSQSFLEESPLLAALLAQSQEAVIIAGAADRRILKANARALELLGWRDSELKDRHLEEICPGKSGGQIHTLLERLDDDNRAGTFHGDLCHSAGHHFQVEMDISLVNGIKVPCYLISFQDLSEKIQAREDILLRNIAIANVTSGVTVADARQPDLPLIYVNKGFQDMTGYSAREAVGRSCRFLQSDDRDQEALEVLRKALREGSSCKVRLRNYRKDGTLFHNELHLSPVRNERGELTHFVGIQLDVTDQVKARESLERSEAQYKQALEQEKELNEIKTRFISMVSHEFRTPMTGIRASAALLRKFGDKLPVEKKDQHLGNIEISLKRMNRLLDDVLFFSRAESKAFKVSRKDLVLSRYLKDFKESLSPIYPDRVIEILCQEADDRAYSLDEHLLDHILQNLIGNALKYSEGTSPVTCEVSVQGQHLIIAVTDKGIGIPQADQPRLFDAFHRAENVGTTQGTGLGLNIVRRAVELLKGKVTFQSVEKEGSTFTVSLPVNPKSKGTQ